MSGDHWYTVLKPGRQEIDWKTQGDPLIAYLREAMPVNITLSSWLLPGRDPAIDPMLSNGYRLYASELPGQLIFASLISGIEVLIETENESPPGADLEPWRSAFLSAYNRIFEEEPEYSWWAALGPSQGAIAEVLKLTEGGTVGEVVIERADNPYTEAVAKIANPNLGGASIVSSFPVVVRGKSRGYSVDAAMRRATVELNTVCALLSLEFESAWNVRQPAMIDDGSEITLPSFGFGLTDGRHHPIVGMIRRVSTPSWMDGAAHIVGDNETLFSALHSHREGLALMDEHPSLALVCFVSAIEGVGSTLVDLAVCDECKSRIGAGKRFRKALKTVFTNREVDALTSAYELRSQTAHSGTLHGEETSMGMFMAPLESFAGRAQSMDFRYETLWALRDASKKVLVKQLSQ